MYKKILVPIDGSEDSLQVIRHANALAKDQNSSLYILTVIPESTFIEQYPAHYSSPDFITISETRADLILVEAKKHISYSGQVYYHKKTGSPAKEIVAFADEIDADLILIGNRGLGAFSRTLLGSVSNRVINLTNKNVLVVKRNVFNE